ncbi:hypothetical protein SAMN05421890_1925 [Ensifer adhaerens]|nr:hypothetical protein SAMN05421890_1925 [Ensifer adhaerens]
MAEKGRAAKLKRLVAVQRHMERIAELELAETTQRRQELSGRMEEAIEAIGSFNPIHASMKSQYAAQYGRLSGEDQHLVEVQDVQEKQILKEKAKGDRLEENWKEARSAEDREREDNAVIDLLEIRLSMPSPASSKLGEE